MSTTVAAQYKKQDGALTLSAAGAKAVQWKPAGGSAAPVTISIAEITNLQKTPANAAKASIRITAQENHTFTFTSASARDDQQATTSTLQAWIEAAKSSQPPARPASTAPAAENGGAPSASTVMAQTATGLSTAPRNDADTYDDAKLMADSALQKSLIASNPVLRQRFEQAVRDKPDAITIAQLSSQFWSTRLHLLRSHAAEKAQGPGTYNVLSVVKPQNENGVIKLNMTKEQIQLIFAQHPLVKKVYNENVPQIKEGDFWSRFFYSRLIKKLRGEKITDQDNVDAKLDKYLNMDDGTELTPQQESYSIPRFLDVEGNEQNHSQRQGNRPDWTMQPEFQDKAPILRTLNRMSEKMMADVPSSDADRHAPVGMDEETYKELQLRDLQRADDDNRVILNIKDQTQLFAAGQGLHTSSSASTYKKRTPTQVLSTVQHDLGRIATGNSSGTGLNLEAAIGVKEDSSSDEESKPKKKARVGSRSTRTAATLQILKAVRKRQLHNDDYLISDAAASAQQAAKLGLSQAVFDSLAMTHNTTVEFLHYFWTVYHSGDPDRAAEVARLVETLEKSLDRIKAVADTAEDERKVKIKQAEHDNEAYFRRSGKKRKFDPNSIVGGAKAVNEIVSPLVRAIRSAKEQFEQALKEQMGQTAGPAM